MIDLVHNKNRIDIIASFDWSSLACTKNNNNFFANESFIYLIMLEHPKEYYRDIIVIERKQEINTVTLNCIFSATGT